MGYVARNPLAVRAPDRARSGHADLEWLAWLMDRAFTIPGTRVRVGLDALIGLLPVGGDVLTGLVQAGIVLTALLRERVPRPVAARMAANVLIDMAVGAIPIVGDLFDVAFKANTRNLELLRQAREHRERGEAMPAGPSVRFLLLIGASFGAALLLLLIGFVALVVWLVRGARF